MPDYTNESTLVLFKNDKGENPKRPDYRGKIFLNGEEYKVSCWIQTKKDGSNEKYMKGKIEKAQTAASGFVPPKRDTEQTTPSKTDDIPF